MTYDPNSDGVDHVNIYSKGATELGRFCSNFAFAPIMTEDGSFLSVEGYWHWLGTGHSDRDTLRKLYGSQALMRGRELKKECPAACDGFVDKIKRAIKIKFLVNDKMFQELACNELPLSHYYVYGGAASEPQGYEWITEYIEQLAAQKRAGEIKAGVGIFVINGDQLCLGRRADNQTFAIPGGSMEPGETPRDAAIRELFEEVGIAVGRTDLVDDITTFSKGKSGLDWTTFHFIVNYSGALRSTEPEKFQDAAWYPTNALPEPLFAPLVEYLRLKDIAI